MVIYEPVGLQSRTTVKSIEAPRALQREDLAIPPGFQDLSRFPKTPNLYVDKFGIPVQTNEVRSMMVDHLSEAVKNETNWACLIIDIDQLKTANDQYSRSLGDDYLRWLVAQTTQAVSKANFSDTNNIFVLRRDGSADEVVVWFFGLKGEDLKKTEKIYAEVGQPRPVETPKGPFTFSTSAGLIRSDSQDPKVIKAIEDARNFLSANPIKPAFDFFKEVEDMADTITKQEKIAKDLEKIDAVDFLTPNRLNAFTQVLVDQYGGARVSKLLMEILLKLQSVKTVLSLNRPEMRGAYTTMLKEIGVNEEDITNAHTANDLIKLFQNLFGSTD